MPKKTTNTPNSSKKKAPQARPSKPAVIRSSSSLKAIKKKGEATKSVSTRKKGALDSAKIATRSRSLKKTPPSQTTQEAKKELRNKEATKKESSKVSFQKNPKINKTAKNGSSKSAKSKKTASAPTPSTTSATPTRSNRTAKKAKVSAQQAPSSSLRTPMIASPLNQAKPGKTTRSKGYSPLQILAQQHGAMLKKHPKKRKNNSFSPSFLEKQKSRLLQLKDTLLDSMKGVAHDNLHSEIGTSALGMHQADAGSDAYDRDFALSILSQEQNSLYEIDEALHRVDNESYGVCEISGESIPRPRLEALPFTRYTVECQAELERHQHITGTRFSVSSLFGILEEEMEGEEDEYSNESPKEVS